MCSCLCNQGNTKVNRQKTAVGQQPGLDGNGAQCFSPQHLIFAGAVRWWPWWKALSLEAAWSQTQTVSAKHLGAPLEAEVLYTYLGAAGKI